MHPGGWVIGPWGAISPSVIGLDPMNAGIYGGSAFLTGTNTAGGARSGAQGGVTALSGTGAPNSISAGRGVVSLGTHGTGISAPAGALSASGTSMSGGTRNEQGGPATVIVGGPSGAITGVGNAGVSVRREGASSSTVASSGGTANSVSGARLGVAGGNSGRMVVVGGTGFGTMGRSIPFSVSSEHGVTGNGRGSTGAGVAGASLGGIAASGNTGVSASGTPLSAPGTRRGAPGTSLVGTHSVSATTNPSATVTNIASAAGPHRGAVPVNAGNTSPSVGSEFREHGISGNSRTVLSGGGTVVGGSRDSGSARNLLLSGSTRVGGSSVGLNGGDISLSHRAGLAGPGDVTNVGGVSVIGGARAGGHAAGAMPAGAHLGGNGGFSSSGVTVIRGTESLSYGGRVGLSGGAVSTEGTHSGNRAVNGGVRVTAGNSGSSLVSTESDGNRFTSSVTGIPRHSAVLSSDNTPRTPAATASTSNIRNARGYAGGVHSVRAGSSSVGNGNAARGSSTGNIGAVLPNAVAPGSVTDNVDNVAGAAAAGRIETQPSGPVGNNGHSLGVLHGSVSHSTMGIVGVHADRNAAGSSLTAVARPTATDVTSIGETVSTTNVGRPPVTVNGAVPGTGISMAVPGSGVNSGGNVPSRSETSYLNTTRGSSTAIITSGTEIPRPSISVSSGGSRVSIGAERTHSHATGTNGVAISGPITVITSLRGNNAHSAYGSSTGTHGNIRTENALTSGGSNGAAAVHSDRNGALGGHSGLSSAGVTFGTGSALSGALVNSGAPGGVVGAEGMHSHRVEVNMPVNSGMTSLPGNGAFGGSGGRTPAGGISHSSVTAARGVGFRGGNMPLGPENARFPEAITPSGRVIVLSPGSTARNGNVGSSLAGERGGTISVLPAGSALILPFGTGSGASLSTLTPEATASTAVTGPAGVGRSRGEGSVVSLTTANVIPGGGRTGSLAETVAGGANTAASLLSSTGNTAATGGTSPTSVTVHSGTATTTRATGSESPMTASYPAITVMSGNGGHGSVRFVLQPGGAPSSAIGYGVPPIPTLRSASVPATTLSSGGTVSSHLTELSSSTNTGVDLGESRPITETTRLGAGSVNNTGSVIA
uniref:TIL domain containing protein n=1 Tax=Rhipicephalus zambeziensis TaxID=60191 RepID=A0A224YFJ3_9ACAR